MEIPVGQETELKWSYRTLDGIVNHIDNQATAVETIERVALF
jgi:hypothetical protein